MSITEKFRNKLFKKRNNYSEFYSLDSKSTNYTFDGFNKIKSKKSVSFNGVEIIDVESYKDYNKLDRTKLETYEIHLTKECKECYCLAF